MILWGTALEMKDWHQFSNFNLLLAQWRTAKLTDAELAQALRRTEALNDREETRMTKALTFLGLGERSEGLDQLKQIFKDDLEEDKDEEEVDFKSHV